MAVEDSVEEANMGLKIAMDTALEAVQAQKARKSQLFLALVDIKHFKGAAVTHLRAASCLHPLGNPTFAKMILFLLPPVLQLVLTNTKKCMGWPANNDVNFLQAAGMGESAWVDSENRMPSLLAHIESHTASALHGYDTVRLAYTLRHSFRGLADSIIEHTRQWYLETRECLREDDEVGAGDMPVAPVIPRYPRKRAGAQPVSPPSVGPVTRSQPVLDPIVDRRTRSRTQRSHKPRS